MMKLVKYIGQPFCILLYAAFIYLAVKGQPIPLIALFLMHLTEYFIIGRKTGNEFNLSPLETAVKCLSFGFTWWLPLRKSK